MRDTQYRVFNSGKSFSSPGASLRYLKGKDLREIAEDDPDFFAEGEDILGDIPRLSSSRRILKKIPRRQRKEVH